MIQLGRSRHGDNAPLAVLQLVGQEEAPGSVTRPEKTARRRRAERRYAAAARAVKKTRPAAPAEPAQTENVEPAGDEPAAE